MSRGPGRSTKLEKLSKQQLTEAAKTSISICNMLKSLGLQSTSWLRICLKKQLNDLAIDTTHFRGQAANSGENYKGFPKKPWQEVLVKRKSGRRAKSTVLRRALIESGRPFACQQCGVTDSWNGKFLMLQVDHLNRNYLDDRKENLRFCCPNCHSQTLGWCGSLGLAEIASTGRLCKSLRLRRRLRDNIKRK